MKKHIRRENEGTLSHMIKGLLFGVLLFGIISLILGFAAYLSGNPTSLTGIFSTVALMLSFFGMGIFVSVRRVDSGALETLLCAASLTAILLIIELIVKKGAVSVPFLINCACSVGSALTASAISKKKRKNRRKFK